MTVGKALSSQAWIIEQLIRLYRDHPELIERALERLLNEDTELRWALVVNAYLDGQINLGKAAELLGIHELELRDHFLHLGIPVRLGSADFEEAKAEVEALRSWFHSPSKTPKPDSTS